MPDGASLPHPDAATAQWSTSRRWIWLCWTSSNSGSESGNISVRGPGDFGTRAGVTG
jgi:hypothetical protein